MIQERKSSNFLKFAEKMFFSIMFGIGVLSVIAIALLVALMILQPIFE